MCYNKTTEKKFSVKFRGKGEKVMKVNYTVKKMTLRPASKEHIEKKLAKLPKFFSDDADVSIMLRPENGKVTAELTIRDAATVFRAEDTQTELTDAFDNAFDNIIRRIRRQKTKLAKRLKSAAFEPDDFADLPDDPIQDDGDEFKVVRVKSFSIKPLSVQEAILQMNMVGHHFYMFRNEQTGEMNVVYERNNGEYGLIEPE